MKLTESGSGEQDRRNRASGRPCYVMTALWKSLARRMLSPGRLCYVMTALNKIH